jgi:hypothetical protein
MNTTRSRQAALFLIALAAVAIGPAAQAAAARRFEPIPESQAQPVKLVGEVSIISAAAKQFHAGASMSPDSAKTAWLSVSVKNMGTVPIEFADGAIVVTSMDKPMAIRSADEAMKDAKGEGLVKDPCANATPSSQRNCTIDVFNRQQAKRTDQPSEQEAAAARQLAPGELKVKQYQVELPKQSKAVFAMLKVSVTIGGEQVSFNFKEVE